MAKKDKANGSLTVQTQPQAIETPVVSVQPEPRIETPKMEEPKIETPKMSIESIGLDIVAEKPVGGRGRTSSANSKTGEIIKKLQHIKGDSSYHTRSNSSEGWYKIMEFGTKLGASSCIQNLKKSHAEMYAHFEMVTRGNKETGGSKLVVRYKGIQQPSV